MRKMQTIVPLPMKLCPLPDRPHQASLCGILELERENYYPLLARNPNLGSCAHYIFALGGASATRCDFPISKPEGNARCTCFWAIAISPEFKGPPPQDQLKFAEKVLDEDRVMCENQVPSEVPINPAPGGWGVLVVPGDTLANTFQKCLRKYLIHSIAATEQRP